MTYNTRSPAVKRLMKEAAELSKATELYYAQPSEDNLFEWHFTIRGTVDSEFSGGIYHGRILLPADYPMKPPNIVFLTENGRFETNRRICLSISSYHPESWRPSWSIRTALLAIIGFMTTPGLGAIASLDFPKEERKRLAREFTCELCGSIKSLLLPLTDASKDEIKEARDRASEMIITAKAEKIEEIAGEPLAQTENQPTLPTNNMTINPNSQNFGESPNSPFMAPFNYLNGSSYPGMPTPPFWICFPYYPNGFPGFNPMFNFLPMPPTVAPASPNCRPMSFEEFVKNKNEQKNRESRPSTSTTVTEPTSFESSEQSASTVTSTVETKAQSEPVQSSTESVQVSSESLSEETIEERATRLGNSLFESAAHRHRLRAERMRINTEIDSPSQQSRQNPLFLQLPADVGSRLLFAVFLLMFLCLFFRRYLAIILDALNDFNEEQEL